MIFFLLKKLVFFLKHCSNILFSFLVDNNFITQITKNNLLKPFNKIDQIICETLHFLNNFLNTKSMRMIISAWGSGIIIGLTTFSHRLIKFKPWIDLKTKEGIPLYRFALENSIFFDHININYLIYKYQQQSEMWVLIYQYTII